MTDYLNNRESGEKFTTKEFNEIPRNSDGDIVDLYDAYAFITKDQRELLSGDDWSRMQEYDDELTCLMAEAMEEFC